MIINAYGKIKETDTVLDCVVYVYSDAIALLDTNVLKQVLSTFTVLHTN